MEANIESVKQIAAIDLGSNSFHMVVAKVIANGLQIVSTHKQRVRMADGFDDELYLDAASMQRGLDCLAIFAERIQNFPPETVRIAATHTLRTAKNTNVFLRQAKRILPYPIEVIPGEEEARLIYLGVAHTQHETGKKLVIDIGGGSTEFIIGEEFEPLILRSRQLGCVSFTNKYFKNGKLNQKNFNKAILAAEQNLTIIAKDYKNIGWKLALGSSGTIKTVREVCLELGYDDGMITLERIEHVIKELLKLKHIDELALEGVSEQREPVFAAGVAILYAAFKTLNIKQMQFSEGALREGLMYEMEDRFQRLDIRMRTAENLAEKHRVNLEHAARVQQQSELFLNQLSDSLAITPESELGRLLKWSAILHEVGLNIAYKGFHRHSAYILENTNMPGFNQEQQMILSILVRFQRKSLKLQEIPELSLYQTEQIIPLIGILRLSIILNAQRNSDIELPSFTLVDLNASRDRRKKHYSNYLDWQLTCDEEDWQDGYRLLHAALLEEQTIWKRIGWSLELGD